MADAVSTSTSGPAKLDEMYVELGFSHQKYTDSLATVN